MSHADDLAAIRKLAEGYPELEKLVDDFTKMVDLLEIAKAEAAANLASAKAWKSAAMAQQQHAIHAGKGLLVVKELAESITKHNYISVRERILKEIEKCLSQTVKHGSAPTQEKLSSP